MKKAKITTIALHYGYMESAHTAPIFYSSKFFDTYFEDAETALIILAEDLYDKFLYETERTNNNGCCKSCNQRLKQEFILFIKDLARSTVDSYGEAEESSNRQYSWYPFWTWDSLNDIASGNGLIIWENAEEVLCYFLGKKYPDIFTSNLDEKYINKILNSVGKIKKYTFRLG